MLERFNIEADIAFSMERGGSDDHEPQTVTGTVTGSGHHIEVHCDDVGALSSGSSVRDARQIAAALAGEGLSVALVGKDGPIVTIGDVKAGLLARAATRSRHIRIDSLKAATNLARSRGTGGKARGSLLPPPTLWPIAPTFRWSRRRPTTTHDPAGGGRPRLVFSMGAAATSGGQRRVFDLPKTGTSIGSNEFADLRLSGVAPEQARVRRDSGTDEYILVALGGEIPTKVNGVRVTTEQVLRTGSRVEMGPWTMVYSREEFADHGRPYGGRAGGEFSRQRDQPKPKYEK